jgi:PAS domain S-box-containing protein
MSTIALSAYGNCTKILPAFERLDDGSECWDEQLLRVCCSGTDPPAHGRLLKMMETQYNLCLSIGNHIDLQRMLDESLDAYLNAFKCDCGFTCATQEDADGCWRMELIHARTREADQVSYVPYRNIAERLVPGGPDAISLEAFYTASPRAKTLGDYTALVMPLPDYGALILVGAASVVDQRHLKTLDAVNRKLGRACINLTTMQSSGRSAKMEKAEETNDLRLEKAYLDQLFDNAQVGIIMAENDGTVIRINPEFQRIFGYSCAEAVGRNIDNLVAAPEDRDEAAGVTQSVSEGQRHAFQAIRHAKDGSRRHVAVMASPIVLNGSQVAVYAFYRDLSQQRYVETELLKAKKLEATGKLAGGIAHDFNNLLTIIMGSIDIVRLELATEKKPDLYHLEQAKQVCRRAHELTQRFITFSDGDLLIKQSMDLSTILRPLAETINESIDVVCTYDIMDDLWSVQADRKQLRLAISEIVSNATEAISADGEVKITAANVTLDGLNRKSPASANGPSVRVIIEDNGVGIPAEVLPQIFDPYYSTKPLSSRTGLGLGLTIAHSIVTKHGGAICVDSEPMVGTRVMIDLPANGSSASR